MRYAANLKELKNQHLYSPLPHINLYYVVFNANYKDIKSIVDLAQEIKADSIEFAPIDIMPGKTDKLILDKNEVYAVTQEISEQLKRIKEYNVNEPVKLIVEQVDNFIKRINSEGALSGRYESDTVTKQPCFVGWAFVRIDAKGDVSPCLKAVNISIGNIYEKTFQEIWNSHEEKLFRQKALALDPEDKYFVNIGNNPNSSFGCLNSCDNIQINMEMYHKYGEILRKYGRIRCL